MAGRQPAAIEPDVQADGLVAGLTEFLAGDHPKLSCYMGEVKFAGLARSYIHRHSSSSPNARWYSRHLAEFMRTTRPYSRQPEFWELAELDRALNEARDAPVTPIVTKAYLAGFDPGEPGETGFVISRSVRRFRVHTNVTSLWASLKCGEFPPTPLKLEPGQELLVWRQGLAPRFRMLGDEEAMALDAAITGENFAAIRNMISRDGDAATGASRAMTYLWGWIEAEIIERLLLDERHGESNRDRSA